MFCGLSLVFRKSYRYFQRGERERRECVYFCALYDSRGKTPLQCLLFSDTDVCANIHPTNTVCLRLTFHLLIRCLESELHSFSGVSFKDKWKVTGSEDKHLSILTPYSEVGPMTCPLLGIKEREKEGERGGCFLWLR